MFPRTAALSLLGLLASGCWVIDNAREEKAAEEKAEAAKWKVDAATRKKVIAKILADEDIRAAAYQGDSKFSATVNEEDLRTGSNSTGLVKWVCDQLREEKAVSAERMTVILETPAGKVLEEYDCRHHTLDAG